MRQTTRGIRSTLMLLLLSFTSLYAGAARAADLVGTIPGHFDVSRIGSATYTIPIELRTGTGGMRPSIALHYDHNAGSGIAGMNWDLVGLSRIDRCPRTVDQDGAAAGVKFDSSDRFCLDGLRLVAIAGTYGASGTEYRTEIDTFRKIESFGSQGGGPRYFLVTERDGTRHWYGNGFGSSFAHPTTNAYQFWARYRTKDTFGNRIDYKYTGTTAGGEGLLTEIEYTWNDDVSSPLARRYRVVLGYDDRPASDQRTGYRYGATSSQKKRLKTISHYQYGAGAALVHDYVLNYGVNANGRSQLLSVKQCRGTSCFPATEFDWQSTTIGWDSLVSSGLSSAGHTYPLVGDFNGDGQKDLYVASGGNWYVLIASGGNFNTVLNTGATAQYPSSAKAGDFDGDGRTDIVFKGSDGKWHVYLSTGVATTGQAFTDIDTGESWSGSTVFAIQDVDGDGRADLLYKQGSSIYLKKSTGNDLSSTATNVYTSFSMSTFVGASFDQSSKPIIDFDGDGLGDLIERRAELVWNPYIWEYETIYEEVPLTFNGTSYVAGPVIEVDSAGGLMYVDFNGDGLSDLAYPHPMLHTWHVRYSTGMGFGAATNTGISSSGHSRALFADYDADGRQDLVRADSGTWYLHKGNDTGFASGAISLGSLSGASTGYPMDVDGNGQDDIVVNASSQWRLRRHKIGLAHAVTRFEDGLGNFVQPVYAPISTSDHYDQHYFGSPPTDRSYQEPMYVVTDYTANDGKGGTYTNLMRYWGAKMHLRGRGFLGFYQVRKYDRWNSGYRLYRRFYEQSFPYTGLLASEEYRIGTWNDLRRLVNPTPQSNSPHAGVYFVRNETTTTATYGLGGTHGGRVVHRVVDNPAYDTTYGYLTSRTITTTSPIRPGESFTTSFSYTQNPSPGNWCLDMPSATSVTRSDHLNSPVTRSFSHTYDATKCRVLSTSSTTGTDNHKKLRATYTYDDFGNLETQTLDNVSGSEADRKSEFVYDAWGEKPSRLIQHIAAGPNPETAWIWDYVNGQPDSVTDAQGQTTSYTFDGLGRIDVETRPDGTTVDRDYLDCAGCWSSGVPGFEIRFTDSAGPDTGLFFNRYGRSIGARHQLVGGKETRRVTVYDQLGRVERTVGPWVHGEASYPTDYEYDLLGRVTRIDRPTSESNPSGSITQIAYDGDTRTVTNAKNQVTAYEFDAAGRVARITGDLNDVTRYEYAAFGQLSKVTDPDNAVTTMSYHPLGWKTAMTAPDMGTWNYDYNAFGELIWQRDAKLQEVDFTYNQLGLPTTRDENEGITTWGYYTAADHRLWLPSSVAAPGFSETYGYDTLSRPTSTVTTIGGKSYTTTLSYHNSGSAIGQLRRIEYPTSTSGSTLLADYDYDSDGILYRVKDGDAPSTVWYELKETDALGQPRHGRFGNGLDQYLDYDDATHRLASIKSGPGTTPSLQNLRYEWDKLGNLEFRHDDRQGLTEAFYYDDLNRLDEVFLGSTSTLSLTYSLSGNVSYKSDVGTYTYSTHSKAVDQITGLRPATYLYDANGNRTRHNGDDITWFSYNLPNRIDYGTDYAEFDYGPDRQRTKQVARTGSSTITTYYAGPHFEEESNGTATTFRHHILFGGQTVALVEKPTAGGTRTHYVHRDHLSAVDALTDGAQLVSQRLSFDAFGKRRNTDWTADTADIRFTDSHTTERGYTGHEHLDNVRMVHMNGRVLDPIIGRVISADPTVPDPYNGQAFNRMSYVYNNPLSFIDPSGFEGIESAPVPALSSDNSVVRRFLMKLGFNDNKYERTDILAHSLQSPALGAATPFYNPALVIHPQVECHMVCHGVPDFSFQRRYTNEQENAIITVGLIAVDFAIPLPAVASFLRSPRHFSKSLPSGFRSAEEFADFGQTLKKGLADAGFDDTVALLQGSAVTGKSFRTGRAFDEGRMSDFDIALAGNDILARAKQLDVPLRSGGSRTGPLTAAQIRKLGLDNVQSALSTQAGRPVNFMIFGDPVKAAARAPSLGL